MQKKKRIQQIILEIQQIYLNEIGQKVLYEKQ